MSLPFFYTPTITAGSKELVLHEDTSRHIVQVLRMQNEEQLQLTDGLGNLFTAKITDNNKKACSVNILTVQQLPLLQQRVTIAISLVKNNSRFEWFLEKATEIGVAEIVPLICSRTEKQHFKYERMNNILISAMLQSQQARLPVLHEPVKFADYLIRSSAVQSENKFIAHCEDESNKVSLPVNRTHTASTILIGPEGDFTKDEIALALKHNYIPVSLGETRLRTETAGIVSAVLLVTAKSNN